VAYKRFQKSISSDTTGNQFQVILRTLSPAILLKQNLLNSLENS